MCGYKYRSLEGTFRPEALQDSFGPRQTHRLIETEAVGARTTQPQPRKASSALLPS